MVKFRRRNQQAIRLKEEEDIIRKSTIRYQNDAANQLNNITNEPNLNTTHKQVANFKNDNSENTDGKFNNLSPNQTTVNENDLPPPDTLVTTNQNHNPEENVTTVTISDHNLILHVHQAITNHNLYKSRETTQTIIHTESILIEI
jgi:hypothetical protein